MDQKQKNEVMKKIRSQVEGEIESNIPGNLQESAMSGGRGGSDKNSDGGQNTDRNVSRVLGKGPIDSSKNKAEIVNRIREGARAKMQGADGQKAQRLSSIMEQSRAQLRSDYSGSETSQAERNEEAKEIKKGAQKKMEKKLSKTMSKGKAKLISKATGEVAYRIAMKLKEMANRGGHWAILVFIFTFVIAVVIDILDIFGDLLVETIIGIILIFLINFFLSLVILFFWTFVLGGGHPKWFWKRVIRMIIGFFVVEAIPILEIFPFTTFIVCWNWYDFQKERHEAKEQLKILISAKH